MSEEVTLQKIHDLLSRMAYAEPGKALSSIESQLVSDHRFLQAQRSQKEGVWSFAGKGLLMIISAAAGAIFDRVIGIGGRQ